MGSKIFRREKRRLGVPDLKKRNRPAPPSPLRKHPPRCLRIGECLRKGGGGVHWKCIWRDQRVSGGAPRRGGETLTIRPSPRPPPRAQGGGVHWEWARGCVGGTSVGDEVCGANDRHIDLRTEMPEGRPRRQHRRQPDGRETTHPKEVCAGARKFSDIVMN